MSHRTRHAVRAVMLTPEARVLLLLARDPASGRRVWFTPGGAVEAGETPRAGLRREIFEETGRSDLRIGPEIWTRSHLFEWSGHTVHQSERFFLVETQRFEPNPRGNPETGELEQLQGFRWWSIPDLAMTKETVAPRRLADLIARLVAEGPPAEPFDAGV